MLRDASLIPLSHHHQHGLAQCLMTRQSLAADGSVENVAMLARRIVRTYEQELANHFEIEEQVLFPACGEKLLIEQLLREHRALEDLIARLRAAPSAALLEQYCALLSGHIRREESELFERVQRDVTRETLDRLGAEIGRLARRTGL
jgi:hemerythrin-like domain-containing protein